MLTIVRECSTPLTMPSAPAASVTTFLAAESAGTCPHAMVVAAKIPAMQAVNNSLCIADPQIPFFSRVPPAPVSIIAGSGKLEPSAASSCGVLVSDVVPAPIRKNEGNQQTGGRSVPTRIDREREELTDLEGTLAVNSRPAQAQDTQGLDCVFLGHSVLGDIEVHVGMRIDPIDLGQDAALFNGLIDVELRLHGVMCPPRHDGDKQRKRSRRNEMWHRSHLGSSLSVLSSRAQKTGCQPLR